MNPKKTALLGSLILAAASLVLPANQALATDTTLHDGFKAPSLDLSKWNVLSGSGGISTNVGLPEALSLAGPYGPSYHKRIDSDMQFAAGTYALARMQLNGDYQKFGFRVNASETGGLEAGAYFDTLDPAWGGAVDTVYAVMRDCTSGMCLLTKEPISVSWGAWHIFKVVWMLDGVDYYVDGELRASYQVPLGGTSSKPVGVWNDRASTMLVDWVFTTPKLVSLTYADLGGIISDLDGWNYCPLPCNASAKITEFSQESGVLFTSSIHTASALEQSVGIFLLNEGSNLSFNNNQPDPFENRSTPPGTSVQFNDLGWGGTFGPTPPAKWLVFMGQVSLSNIQLKMPPKKGVANIHLGLHFTRDYGVTTERVGINVHVKP